MRWLVYVSQCWAVLFAVCEALAFTYWELPVQLSASLAKLHESNSLLLHRALPWQTCLLPKFKIDIWKMRQTTPLPLGGHSSVWVFNSQKTIKSILTWHKQSTKAIGNFFHKRPNHQATLPPSVLHQEAQTVQNAYTCRKVCPLSTLLNFDSKWTAKVFDRAGGFTQKGRNYAALLLSLAKDPQG